MNLAYLVAAILFILTFKLLAHPRTAVRGNLFGALGMALAVGATLFDPNMQFDERLFVIGLAAGDRQRPSGRSWRVQMPMTGDAADGGAAQRLRRRRFAAGGRGRTARDRLRTRRPTWRPGGSPSLPRASRA